MKKSYTISHLFHQKRGIWCLFVAPLFLAVLITYGLGFQILFNSTHSLPHNVYCLNPFSTSPKRGDLIAFSHHASNKIVVKRVIGVEGDTISHDQHGIVINKTKFNLKEKRSNGNPLTPIKAEVISTGMVFVAGEHKDSFDSRYEEFGLVPVATVRGRVWPIF